MRLVLLVLAACGPVPCDELAEVRDRDRCLYDEIAALPATEAAGVVDRAGRIEDAMIRGAAVSAWIAAHANKITSEQGAALCKLLDGRDQSYCERRLSSPHLQR